MNTKLRTDSAFAELSSAQQASLFDWLLTSTYAQVQKKIALPPPDGFSIQTSVSALQRFYRFYRHTTRAEDQQFASDVKLSVLENDSSFDPATTATLEHRAFRLATESDDAEDFSRAGRWWKWKRDLELKERAIKADEAKNALAETRLALEKLKFEFSAARAAIFHFAELHKICTNPDTDDEQKIWETHGLFFGKKSDPIGPLGDGIPRAGHDEPGRSLEQAQSDPSMVSQISKSAVSQASQPASVRPSALADHCQTTDSPLQAPASLLGNHPTQT